METAVKTQNKYQVSIDLLNDAVGKEIATSLQYMYFHTHFEDDRYQYLSKIMREISRCAISRSSPTASCSCRATST